LRVDAAAAAVELDEHVATVTDTEFLLQPYTIPTWNYTNFRKIGPKALIYRSSGGENCSKMRQE
jgi:hypothetical protein